MFRKLKKIFILAIVILTMFCGCGEVEEPSTIRTEHQIKYVKYTADIGGLFNEHLNETIELTYTNAKGERITTAYSAIYLVIGNENKIVYVNEGNIWNCYCEYIMLTQDVYDKMVSSSPMVVSIESEVDVK
jgi:hypothetical protein